VSPSSLWAHLGPFLCNSFPHDPSTAGTELEDAGCVGITSYAAIDEYGEDGSVAHMVLPDGMLLHASYLCAIFSPALEGLRRFVDAHPAHPDDIAINLLVQYLHGDANSVPNTDAGADEDLGGGQARRRAKAGRPVVVPKKLSLAVYKEADEARDAMDKAREARETDREQEGQEEQEGQVEEGGGERRRLGRNHTQRLDQRRRRLGMAGGEYWDYLRSQGLLWCSRYFATLALASDAEDSATAPTPFVLQEPPPDKPFDPSAWAAGQTSEMKKLKKQRGATGDGHGECDGSA
jgi:hypothetical protein